MRFSRFKRLWIPDVRAVHLWNDELSWAGMTTDATLILTAYASGSLNGFRSFSSSM